MDAARVWPPLSSGTPGNGRNATDGINSDGVGLEPTSPPYHDGLYQFELPARLGTVHRRDGGTIAEFAAKLESLRIFQDLEIIIALFRAADPLRVL